ncbi:MAG: hypothetical protein IJY08_06400 [Clostridia bacterium]|nr:hypothetical protein [Clostridia bacterium]
MSRIYRIIITFLASLILLTGCVSGDVVDTDINTDVIDSISETLDTSGDEDSETENNRESKSPWVTKTVNGLSVREIVIDIEGDGDAVDIVQLTDVHFNAVNEQDIAENNKLVMGSYNDKQNWLKDGASAKNLQKCLDYAADYDQIVVTGDLISYLSYGNLELVKKYIFDPYPDALACVGNHDALRDWKCQTDESATLAERLSLLQSYWTHDIYYASKVLKDRVMVIQLENGIKDAFWDIQVEKLTADLALAREKGYAVLLFYHIPLSTRNPKYYNTKALTVGDKNNAAANFFTEGIDGDSEGASGEVYKLITNNADIIKGCFCGHKHSDFYTEINAKTPDGTDTTIPQYILIGVPYGTGNVLRITVK